MCKKIKYFFVVALTFMIIMLSACGKADMKSELSFKLEKTARQAAVELPQTERFNKLLDQSGKIDIEYLDNETVSVIKKNYDNRVFIKHNNQAFFYNPVYISYDQIINSRLVTEENRNLVLEEFFAQAKASGFKTVALYVDWQKFFDGVSYNFDYYKIYYSLAEKYDLNVVIIWNGYAKLGYMPWQTDREKYPALSEVTTADVPDLSKEIYINEVCDSLSQFCAWLNYIDYNRRTVLIQLEDEANTNYGSGEWLSQFANFSALIEKMAAAVKSSTYSLVTTVGITFNDFYKVFDGFSGRERIDLLFSSQAIDGLGAAYLNTPDFDIGLFNNNDKFCYISKLSPAGTDFFVNAMSFIKQGCQFGVYELKSFDLTVNCGMYRSNSLKWQSRERQAITRGLLANKNLVEATTNDVCDFIKAINKLGPLLAENSLVDITLLNAKLDNNFLNSFMIGNTVGNFNNTENAENAYNSAAICVVDPFSNYYVLSFYKQAYFAVNFTGNLELTPGEFIDGAWTVSGTSIKNDYNRFLLDSGMVYKFRIDK